MNNKVSIIKDNEQREYEILFRVNDEKKEINYIVYTDNSLNENGNAMIYFARYENNKIIPISHEEIDVLEEIVNIVQKEVCQNED